jgi:hypothetical protein
MRETSSRTALQYLVEAKTERELEAMLRELYVERRHTDAEIAKALSAAVGFEISRASISLWRDQFGISADDRPGISI